MALRKLPTLVSEKPSPALIFSAFVPVPVRVSSVTVILRGALEHVLGQSVKARSGIRGQHKEVEWSTLQWSCIRSRDFSGRSGCAAEVGISLGAVGSYGSILSQLDRRARPAGSRIRQVEAKGASRCKFESHRADGAIQSR